MTDALVYAHAPVVEAVIDIQVALGEDADGCLARLSDSLVDRYPQKLPIHMVAMEMRPDGTSMQRTSVGWRLTSRDGDRVLQVKRQGFTFSHMSPYTRWSVFSGDARDLWARFLASCAPQGVTRVAVRYVNRLELAPGSVEYSDFLALYPCVPAAMKPLTGMLLQVQGAHPDVDPACRAVVTLAREQNQDPKVTFIFDIDVSVERPMQADSDECWNVLERLRTKKNQLFESAIKEKLRETFR